MSLIACILLICIAGPAYSQIEMNWSRDSAVTTLKRYAPTVDSVMIAGNVRYIAKGIQWGSRHKCDATVDLDSIERVCRVSLKAMDVDSATFIRSYANYFSGPFHQYSSRNDQVIVGKFSFPTQDMYLHYRPIEQLLVLEYTRTGMKPKLKITLE